MCVCVRVCVCERERERERERRGREEGDVITSHDLVKFCDVCTTSSASGHGHSLICKVPPSYQGASGQYLSQAGIIDKSIGPRLTCMLIVIR